MNEFNLPAKAYVNKFIPKSKFYEITKVNYKTKQAFVDAIQRITWLYKLSERTINIIGTDNKEEIQIFNIELKAKEIPKTVLKVIDKAIHFPILYRFQYKDNIAFGITTKENAEQRYFFSEWNQDLDFDFTGNTIEQVYQELIKLFIGYKTEIDTKNQDFDTVLHKEKELANLDKEIIALKIKIRTEKQVSKQFALNKTLKQKLHQREQITNS